jgi:hypothetical protein
MYDDDYPTCERTYATLWILQEDLDPDVVTGALAIQPSWTRKRGEIRNPGAKRPVINKVGGWFLRTADVVHSRDVRRHIDWLLDQLEPRREVLAKLQAAGCQTIISCYWLSYQGHGGPMLLPQNMARLASLGLELWFDVYFPIDDEEEHDEETGHADGEGTLNGDSTPLE